MDLKPFYKFAIDHVAVGLHAVDTKGKTILYNKKMNNIEGFDFEELADRSLLEMFRFGQEESTLLKVLQSGSPVLNAKQTYWNRKGQEITTINDTYPVYEAGELIGAIELARDVRLWELYRSPGSAGRDGLRSFLSGQPPRQRRLCRCREA